MILCDGENLSTGSPKSSDSETVMTSFGSAISFVKGSGNEGRLKASPVKAKMHRKSIGLDISKL